MIDEGVFRPEQSIPRVDDHEADLVGVRGFGTQRQRVCLLEHVQPAGGSDELVAEARANSARELLRQIAELIIAAAVGQHDPHEIVGVLASLADLILDVVNHDLIFRSGVRARQRQLAFPPVHCCIPFENPVASVV